MRSYTYEPALGSQTNSDMFKPLKGNPKVSVHQSSALFRKVMHDISEALQAGSTGGEALHSAAQQPDVVSVKTRRYPSHTVQVLVNTSSTAKRFRGRCQIQDSSEWPCVGMRSVVVRDTLHPAAGCWQAEAEEWGTILFLCNPQYYKCSSAQEICSILCISSLGFNMVLT